MKADIEVPPAMRCVSRIEGVVKLRGNNVIGDYTAIDMIREALNDFSQEEEERRAEDQATAKTAISEKSSKVARAYVGWLKQRQCQHGEIKELCEECSPTTEDNDEPKS